mgnify:FL=1
MTAEEIFDKVRVMIAEQLDVNADDITLSMSFEDDLEADSLDLVDLAMGLEDEFDIGETEEGVLEKIKTVGDVVNYISKKLNG